MNIILYLLIPLITLSVIRVIIGPTIWDRFLMLNAISNKLVIAIVVLASVKYSRMFIDVAIIYALLSFIGIVFMADFMKRGFAKNSEDSDD